MKNYFKYFGILTLGIIACEPDFENPIDREGAYTSGEADFSNYVAVGNSLTAGYADNALYITGQQNSYPNILAQQFAKVQQTQEFTIPYMNDNAGGLLYNGEPLEDYRNRRVLAITADGPVPGIYNGTATTEVTNVLEGPFSNMGVPGAKTYHLLAEGYGNPAGVPAGMANPYFARFASSPETSVIQDAVSQDPTFFTLWIGNNDVLGFATSGGAGTDQTGNFNPGTYGRNDITDPQVFEQVYTQLVAALTANGAEGVLLNIPNVTDVPFFTTVPVDAIPLDEETAALLNSRFQAYNEQILPGLANFQVISQEEMQERQINFTAGQNFVTLVDEDLTDISQYLQQAPFNLDPQTATLLAQLRQATPSDLIPLTSSGVLGTNIGEDETLIRGVSVPLEDQYVLTVREQELISAATQAYNETIQSLAQANGLGFVNTAAMLNQVSQGGIPYDAGVVTSDYIVGGAFSLDGVHLTPRGYALVANRIIEEVNDTYDATVPKVNVGAYGTVTPSNDIE